MSFNVSNLPKPANCPTNSVGDITIKTGPWCGVSAQLGSTDVSLNATDAMRACCRDAPTISLSNSCAIYCNALNQTTDQLMLCLSQNFGRAEGNTAGVTCSRKGSSSGNNKVTPHGAAKLVGSVVILYGISSLLTTGSWYVKPLPEKYLKPARDGIWLI